MTTEAGPPIGCPVTGRTWPRARQMDLRVCRRCGGVIDTRYDTWQDGPMHITCPQRRPVQAAAAPAAEKPKVLPSAAWDWPRDEYHEQWLRDEQERQQAEAAAALVCLCGHLRVLHVPHAGDHTGRCTGPCDCPAFTAGW